MALVLLRPAIESLAAGHTVWAVAEAAGLRPLGLVSVDDAWMTLRLKRPVA